MTCERCLTHQVMHRSTRENLCCGCHVLGGDPPADWHRVCMATVNGDRIWLNRAARERLL